MRIIKLIWNLSVFVLSGANNIIPFDSTRALSNNAPWVPTLKESITDLDAKISNNRADFNKRANTYSLHGGKNRTYLHHLVNDQHHAVAVEFLKSILLHFGKIEDAFPKEKLVLEYVFFTDTGTPQYSEPLSALVRLLLRHTKTSRQKPKGDTLTALEVAIEAQVHPRLLQIILTQGNFPVDYDRRYPCSPLSMLMLSKFKSEYEIEDAIKIFGELAVNFTEMAPCRWLDPQKKITALNALCLLEPYEPINVFREVTIRKAKSLIKFGANSIQTDDFGEPFENTVLNYKDFLSEVMIDLAPKKDDLDFRVWTLGYYIYVVIRKAKELFLVLKSNIMYVILFFAIYLGYRYLKKFPKPETSTLARPSLKLQHTNIAAKRRKKPIITKEQEKEEKERKEDDTKPSSPAFIQTSLEILLNTTFIDSDVKKILIEYDQKQAFDLHISWGEQRETLLMYLIRNKYLESLRFVINKIKIQQPSLINEINSQNQTALMLACLTNQPNIINLLLDIPNLYTNLCDEQGDNALAIWLRQPIAIKQKFACAKKLIQRGCEITPAVRRTWGFMSFISTQREELERYAAEYYFVPITAEPTLELEDKKIIETPKNRRRKSLEMAKTVEKKAIFIKEKPRRTSLPTNFPIQQLGIEESKPNTRLQFQENPRLFYLCLRNCMKLIVFFNRKPTNPIEMFCRYAALLVNVLDLAKKINHYINPDNLNTEKSASRDFIYYIRHSVIPPLLRASLLSSAISDVEEIAEEFIRWVPDSLKEKKWDEKSSLSKEESQDASVLLESLISFFEEKNETGLHLKKSKLFNAITKFHESVTGSEFAAAKHEDYVKFALPVINEIYNIYISTPEYEPVLVLLLYSCGDAWVEYGNVNQSKDFSFFVRECRISLRNRLMHDPNTSFLEVQPEEIHYLCRLAKKAIDAQNLAQQANWNNTFYSRAFIKEIASSLSVCGLFSGSNAPGEKVLDYLGYSSGTLYSTIRYS